MGVLHFSLAAGHKIRCYTYVNKDAMSRRITIAILRKLQNQFPDQLPNVAIRGFDDRLPRNVDQCNPTFLTDLVERHGPLDVLGANWECQSVSTAGYCQGVHNPHFKFFFNMVNIISFFSKGADFLLDLHFGKHLPRRAMHNGNPKGPGFGTRIFGCSNPPRRSRHGIGGPPRTPLLAKLFGPSRAARCYAQDDGAHTHPSTDPGSTSCPHQAWPR